MVSKPMRLTSEAEAVALRYGPTVSKGILAMEDIVRQPVANVLHPADTVGGMPISQFQSILSSISSTSTTFTPPPIFVRASTLPVKKIGNINPEDELQEPLGEDGKPV